jgi:hypothetical protein
MPRKSLFLTLVSLALGGLMLQAWFAWDQVTRGPFLHGDPSITHCPLHGDRLLVGHVPWVEGGLPARGRQSGFDGEETGSVKYPRSEREAESMLFPYAHATYRAGCMWAPSMAKVRVWVRYCPTCREARIRWEREPSGSR